MKYSLRKSFSYRRKKDLPDDEHVNPRIDCNGCSNSNSNLVKTNQSKSFLRRSRRYSSSPPPTSSPPVKSKSKTSELPYNNHVNDADEDDNDPFSSSPNSEKRLNPLNKLTYQIRKSFRNTLTRRRPRLESTNSNKRLIFNANDENRPVPPTELPISTGLTSPIVYSIQSTPVVSDEKDKTKAPPKRRKAPLAPTHMNHSISMPDQVCSALNTSEPHESTCASLSNEPQQNLLNKKSKLNRSFRQRISSLLKKRHAKQQQQQQQLQNCTEEEPEHQHHDDQDELNNKKLTLSQRFDTFRRSFHIGKRDSTSKGKRYLLANE